MGCACVDVPIVSLALQMLYSLAVPHRLRSAKDGPAQQFSIKCNIQYILDDAWLCVSRWVVIFLNNKNIFVPSSNSYGREKPKQKQEGISTEK